MLIVRLALRRPYTFVVLAVLIFIVGPLAILRTPTDIFPNIDIPVVSIVWTYNGFSAQDMANRVMSNYERALSSDVDDIEHIESQSLNGVSVVKIFFHPGADINRAIAEAASNSASILRVLPPGTLPPNIITYNASTVPILQLGLSSGTLSEQQLYDLGNSAIRTQLATVQGASVPLPPNGSLAAPPMIPVGVPSQLLERRPDIAAAERRVASANAQIGVARAAFFPDLVLSASAGLESTFFAPWLSAPSLFWSLGPQLAGTLFDGGQRKASLHGATAHYDGAVADYREAVLVAFQQVEDNLSALHALADEAASQQRATRAADLSLRLTTNRFKVGAVSYLDVVTAQTIALTNQRVADQIAARQLESSVLLLKALSGTWHDARAGTAAAAAAAPA